MSVAILLITHGEIGQAIHQAAVSVIGSSPLRTACMSITMETTPEEAFRQAQQHIERLNTGSGVLVLTDMYGATPSNIACTIQDTDIAIISGLNLPMLIRVMNYPSLPLQELAEKAITGGKEGVIYFHCGEIEDVTQEN